MFPRQIWRDRAMALAGDSQALALSLKAVVLGWVEPNARIGLIKQPTPEEGGSALPAAAS